MKMLICPISSQRLNNSAVRITGFLMAAMIALYAITGSIYFIFALVVDYFIRAATPAPYSPFSWVAAKLVDIFRLGYHPLDKAPKIFAARVGFLFALAAALLYFANPTTSLFVALILMFFALLESVFDLCMGCLVYTYVVLPLWGEA